MKITKKQKVEVKHFIESFIAGSAFFWAGYIAFPIFYELLGWSIITANIISYLIGWFINYFLQRYWVFNNPRLKKHEVQTTSRYVVISIVNLVLDSAIIYSLSNLGINPYIGKFLSAGFFTVWNYLWYRYWVFPTKSSVSRRKSARRRQKPNKNNRKL